MSTLLSHWGCRYETADDGETGLALLREAANDNDPFCLALLDQAMPAMDGRELGCRIKADPLLKSTILVMLTSLGRRGDAAALEELGFAGYLPKPVRQSQLHDCVALLLGRATQLSQKPDALTTPGGIITQHTVAEVARHSHGVRILLADDNSLNQKVGLALLNKLGYKADVVANGLEALRALELINYDLVLMDCLMPEMSGFEATSIIRDPASKVLNHNVPIIAITANAMVGDREKCIEAGMDDYISKPVNKEKLALILEKWLMSGDQKDMSAQITDEASTAPLIFNKADMLSRLDNDPVFAGSILEESLFELPNMLEELTELCKGDDAVTIRRKAHTMKGFAAIISTEALREICGNIETAAKDGNLETARELLPDLEQTVIMTIEAIRKAV